MRARLTASVSLAVAIGLGCSETPPPDPGEVACTTDGDCPGDTVCAVNRCFPPDYTGPYCDFILCGEHASCEEGPPPACRCVAGHQGDGLTCADIDECAEAIDDCSEDATCTNLPGTFGCACNLGYAGDGRVCTDIDECAGGTDDCSADADCANTLGGYTCTCHSGFTGDGVTCTDIDECLTPPCGEHATCTNLPGTYGCACDPEYYGDGTDCRESIGQVIWMGHDLFARNVDVDRVVGNAVAQATTLGTIQVLGYRQFADDSPGGERENTDAAIAARLAELGRAAAVTPVGDYTALPALLPTADVLLVYEMELGGDPVTIGTTLAPHLPAFLDAGGVVVVMDHYTQGWRILDTSGVMRFLGQYTGYGDVGVQVTVPDDPVVADVAPSYTGTNGTASYFTNDGTVVVVDPAGLPVVVHKYWDRPRFDGSFGAAWEPLAMNTEPVYSLMTYHPAHQPYIFNMYDSTGQKYSPATNSWTSLVAAGPPANPWFQMAPVGLRLYGFVAYTDDVYGYDTATDVWSVEATFSGVNEYTMAAADEAGRVYGYTNDGDVVVYDPLTHAVTYLPTGIPALRGGNGSLYETRLVYDPGTRSLYLGAYPTPELYRYELDTGVTTQLASIPEPQLNDIFCGDRAGHIYVAGDSGGTTLFQYDIDSDTWSPLPDLPADHGNNGTCVVSDEGWLYVSSGSNNDLYRLPLY